MRPYQETTDMDPDDYATSTEAFQSIQNLKQSTPTTLDDIQNTNNEKSTKVNELLNKITAFNAENDGNKLADFAPLDKPILTNTPKNINDANKYNKNAHKYLDPSQLLPNTLEKQRSGDFLANETPEISYSNYNQTYQNAPLFQKPTSQYGSGQPLQMDSRMMEKINYMIHLLEEQKSEKTAHITEEFILYIFLGVFVIYTVDSFTRAGKYIR